MLFLDTSIPTHLLASWLLKNIDSFLNAIGLSREKTVEEIIYITTIVTLAFAVGWLARRIILAITQNLVGLRKTQMGQELLEQRVLTKCSHVITPLIILAFLPFAFTGNSKTLHICMICAIIYSLITFGIGIDSILDFIWIRYDAKQNTKNLPLKGVLNIGKGILWIIIVIVAVSIAVGKSPAVLLTGLGAFAAALMLIFKDSILGFVAGVQLSENDMLRVGDWIVVPSTMANGIVEDVSLTAVKVRQWDNTIVTLPPYTLVSTSFQNWRGMTESGYRQIEREVYFDTDSVMECTPDFIDSVTKIYPQIKGFVDKTEKAGTPDYDPGLACVNGTVETNLGLFRAYFCQYLLNHPQIGTDQQILVRLRQPTLNAGWPLQIYCYTTTKWTAYEAVQSEIFEHLAVAARNFGLRLYNAPSGEDLRTLKTAPVISEGTSGKSDQAAEA